MGIGYFCRAGVEIRVQSLDERRLAHSGYPGKQYDRRSPFFRGSSAGLQQFPDAGTSCRRNFNYLISCPFVYLVETLPQVCEIFGKLVQNVAFVQDYDRFHPIKFAGDQQTVQKLHLHFRKCEGDDKIGPVQIGRDDMGLTAEID